MLSFSTIVPNHTILLAYKWNPVLTFVIFVLCPDNKFAIWSSKYIPVVCRMVVSLFKVENTIHLEIHIWMKQLKKLPIRILKVETAGGTKVFSLEQSAPGKYYLTA